MDNTVDTKEIVSGSKKYRIKIIQDNDPISPRENDNLGKMVCFHGRYDLGDKHDYDHRDYSGWEEQREAISKNEDVCVILPLYLYDHSGITISTSPFSCRWDSGQVGWILVSKKKVREEYGVKRINKKLVEKVTGILEAEVKEYDQYLTGDVYGYEIYELKTCSEGHEHAEFVDSCWGYYGEEYCMTEAMGVVQHYIDNPKKELVS